MVTAITTNKTRAIVRELYDAYERRDFECVAKLIHDDIDWIIYGPITVFPFAGTRHGRAAVLQVLNDIANVYKLESYVPEIVIVEEERAAVVSDVSFRQRTTGRVLRFRVANFMRLKNGLLIEFREFTNSFDVVEQALGRELKT